MKPLTRAITLALLPTCALSAQGSGGTSFETLMDLGTGFSLHSRDLQPRLEQDPPAGEHMHGSWSAGRPDGHAPIGVMADHLHGAGEWMLSARWMHMHMEGMRDGTDNLSPNDVFDEGFPVTPTKMDMDMLMFGGMYAPTDDWTLMVMVPYVWKSMRHVTAGGARFETESEGVGDVRATVMRGLWDSGDGQRIHVQLGLSIPTGNIDEKDDTPAQNDANLPYPMQIGSGTWDLLPGVTYLGQTQDYSWGAQGTLRFYLGNNDEDYNLGDRGNLTGWVARRLGDFSGSLRVSYDHVSNINGSDDRLNPNMVPTADPDRQERDQIDGLLGINWKPGGGGNRIALEVGIPLYRDLDGPQLETDWTTTIGWQYSR